MRRHPRFHVLWVSVNVLLLVSILVTMCGIVWEFSIEKYLDRFADAVVPLSASPEQKVEAILTWLGDGPARRLTTDAASLSVRNPETTLGYGALLRGLRKRDKRIREPGP